MDLRPYPALAQVLAKVVYHGSPKAFEDFSLDYAGSEQGVNIAWGLYFSEVKKGATFYKKLGGKDGKLYQVKIPDGPYLEWDLPLASQKKVQAILKPTPNYQQADARAASERFLSGEQLNGREYYGGLQHYQGMSQKEASLYLQSLGIVGVRYRHDEYHNYVLFDAGAAKILKTETSALAQVLSATSRHDVEELAGRYRDQFFSQYNLPMPVIKIVDRMSANYIGRCVYRYGDMTTLIEIQKSVLNHEQTLQGTLLHELIHHWQWLAGPKSHIFTEKDPQVRMQKGGRNPGSAGHGADFIEQMNRINQVMGPDFVTPKSSDNDVIEITKDFYVLVFKEPSLKTPYGFMMFQKASPAIKEKIQDSIAKYEGKLFKSRDPMLKLSGSKYVGRRVRSGSDEVNQALKELYETGTPVALSSLEEFPALAQVLAQTIPDLTPAQLTQAVKEFQGILAKNQLDDQAVLDLRKPEHQKLVLDRYDPDTLQLLTSSPLGLPPAWQEAALYRIHDVATALGFKGAVEDENFHGATSYEIWDLSCITPKGTVKGAALAGANGDWKKEGYTLKAKVTPEVGELNFDDGSHMDYDEVYEIEMYDKSGIDVANATIMHNLNNQIGMATDLYVDDQHQRKGLATAMYDYFEEKTGHAMVPSGHLKAPSKKFWKNRKKKVKGAPEMAHLLTSETHASKTINARQLAWLSREVEGIATYLIAPEEFLRLTTSDDNEAALIKKGARPHDFYLSPEAQQDMVVAPHVKLDSDGQIVAHEGRHRAAAALNAGHQEVEIGLVASTGSWPVGQYGWRWKRRLPVPAQLKPQFREGGSPHVVDQSKITLIEPMFSPETSSLKYPALSQVLDAKTTTWRTPGSGAGSVRVTSRPTRHVFKN